MPFAIDLNARQSARTIEQAVRHRAQILLEPRIWSEAEDMPLTCRLEQLDETDLKGLPTPRVLLLTYNPQASDGSPGEAAGLPVNPVPFDRFTHLVGSYCDLAIRLGDQVYLGSADVLKVQLPSAARSEIRIFLTRPKAIQVAQRRRFRRIALGTSSRVRLHWHREQDAPQEGIGWLCNVSADGMACRVDAHVAEQLWIGDVVQANFSLSPTDARRFLMDTVICSKTPAGSEGKTILGMQFLRDADHTGTTQAVEELYQRLAEWHLLASRTADEEGS